jgi:hypothetical protein
MPPSKIECFIYDTKKVFHLQTCNSVLIHKGHDPWHTLYVVILFGVDLYFILSSYLQASTVFLFPLICYKRKCVLISEANV